MIGYSSLYNPNTLIACVRDIVYFPWVVFTQYRAFKTEGPDIVHLNSSILFATAIAAKLAGRRVVWHIRESIVGGRFNLRRQFACWLITILADRILTISPFEAGVFSDKRKIQVVYNAVDLAKFNPALYEKNKARISMGFSLDEKIVVSLGGASFRKGAVQLIQAAQLLNGKVRLIIAGQAPPPPVRTGKARFVRLMLCFEELLIRYGFKDIYSWYYSERISVVLFENKRRNVDFIGDVQDVPLLLAASDAVVFAGTTPHFPRPIYEGWCMKKPVVAFDVENVRQNTENEKDVLLVSKRDFNGLVIGINKILDGENLASALAQNGFKRAVEVFDIAKSFKQVSSIYASLL